MKMIFTERRFFQTNLTYQFLSQLVTNIIGLCRVYGNLSS